jgi:Rrf2 family protein
MKFSRASGSAIAGLVFLAQKQTAQHHDAGQIAIKKGLPLQFLRLVLGDLVKGQVIRSAGRRRGGYCPARPAKDITLLEIVEAMDGPLRQAVPRLEADGNRRLDKRLEAVTDAATELVREQLRGITVSGLVKGWKWQVAGNKGSRRHVGSADGSSPPQSPQKQEA